MGREQEDYGFVKVYVGLLYSLWGTFANIYCSQQWVYPKWCFYCGTCRQCRFDGLWRRINWCPHLPGQWLVPIEPIWKKSPFCSIRVFHTNQRSLQPATMSWTSSCSINMTSRILSGFPKLVEVSPLSWRNNSWFQPLIFQSQELMVQNVS